MPGALPARSYNAANQVIGRHYDANGNLLRDGHCSFTTYHPAKRHVAAEQIRAALQRVRDDPHDHPITRMFTLTLPSFSGSFPNSAAATRWDGAVGGARRRCTRSPYAALNGGVSGSQV